MRSIRRATVVAITTATITAVTSVAAVHSTTPELPPKAAGHVAI